MLIILFELLIGSFFVVQTVFWILFISIILPTLGDKNIKVEYTTWQIFNKTWMNAYVSAYIGTLTSNQRLRWFNRFINIAELLSIFLGVLALLFLFSSQVAEI